MNSLKHISLILIFTFMSKSLNAADLKICLTGKIVTNLPSYKESFENSARLALIESKIHSGVKIETYYYNNKSLEPIQAYNRMIQANCSAIIGFEYLSDLMLIIKTQKTEKIPIFTSYASTIISDHPPRNIFIFMPTYNYLVDKMLFFLNEKFGKIDNVLLITEVNREEMLKYKQVYSKMLNEKKVKFDYFDLLENDNEFVQRFKLFMINKKYKYIFLLSGAIASSKIANLLDHNNVTFIGTENFGSSSSQTFYLLLNNKNIQSYFIRNIDFLNHEKDIISFKKRYIKKFKTNPTVMSAYTYDATNIILKAFSKFSHTQTDNIYAINFNGITGLRLKNGVLIRSKKYGILSIDQSGYEYVSR
jgi:ABC-type branched-subunit amino acid transport system substrate-binding protein